MSSPATILVVDDNPVVRLGVAHMLRTGGYKVLEATNGAECLSILKSQQPDLLLADVILPDISGLELCRQIKADPSAARTFVVLFSETETSPERQASGLDAGADGYIVRPVTNRDIRSRVRAILRAQRAEASLRKQQEELERRVAERTEELARANNTLRSMSLRLVGVQEAERRFMARELHDEIGQILTSLKLSIEMVLRSKPEDLRLEMTEPLKTLDNLMGRIRALSLNLRPQMLDDLGLLVALSWHFKEFFKQTGVQVRFQHTPMEGRLASPLETAIYRVVQEALTNIARHAKTPAAGVKLWVNGESARVQIEDLGAGFDSAAVLTELRTSGLRSMQERAELLGGSFTLESSPGAGTRITVELPLDSGKEAHVSNQ